jgi:hypothetical protein
MVRMDYERGESLRFCLNEQRKRIAHADVSARGIYETSQFRARNLGDHVEAIE